MDYKKTNLLVEELLKGKSFNHVKEDYGLVYNYYLLDGILKVLNSSVNSLTDEENEFLRQLYNENCCQLEITNEKLMIISDTHISSVYDNYGLEYMKMMLEICENNGIKGLLHCGDIGEAATIKNKKFSFLKIKLMQEKKLIILLKIIQLVLM